MAIRIVRLGSPRHAREGLRIGTVRRPPRGVRKADLARRDFYDVWFPNLAPSAALLEESAPVDARSWKTFARRFRKEMKAAGPRHDLALLAALSHETDLAVGCYCRDETRCHRSILGELLAELGAEVVRA